MNKNIFLAIVVGLGAIGLAACSSTTPTNAVSTVNTSNVNNVAAVNKPPADSPVESTSDKPVNTMANVKPPVKTDDTLTADTSKSGKIGVAECDEYLEKYEACVNSKVPEADRAALISPMETMRKGWKNASTNEKAKTALADGCKVALTTAKESLSKFSCDW